MDALADEAPSQTEVTVKAPGYLWAIGVLSFVWNGVRCSDFLMINVRDADYLAQVPPDVIDYFDGYPAWTVIGWGVGVSFSLLGSVLLLTRSQWAAYAFAVSLLGFAATQFYQVAVGVPPSMGGLLNGTMTALVWLVGVGLLACALRMRRRGVLR